MALFLAGEQRADGLLAKDAFALLVGMVLDQQIPLERAFSAPLELKERLGGRLDADTVASMDPAELAGAFSEKPALHRFPAAMAARVQALAQVIIQQYGGDAKALWSTAKSGEDLLVRVRELPGFGEQKAKIFVAFLGKRLGVRPKGWAEAAGVFGAKNSFLSIADIDGPTALARVREHKREMKQAAGANRTGPARPSS